MTFKAGASCATRCYWRSAAARFGVIGVGTAGGRVLCPVVSGAGVVAVRARLSVKTKAANPARTSTAITVGSIHPVVSGSLVRGSTRSRWGSESRASKFFGGEAHRMLLCFCLGLATRLPNFCSPKQKKLRLRGDRSTASMLQRRMFRSFWPRG
jgi:hypothetical protein